MTPNQSLNAIICFRCQGTGFRQTKKRIKSSSSLHHISSSDPVDIDSDISFLEKNNCNKIEAYKQSQFKTKNVLHNDICKNCNGIGELKKSKRRNEDGSYRMKSSTKSYPSFQTKGPLPFYETQLTNDAQRYSDNSTFNRIQSSESSNRMSDQVCGYTNYNNEEEEEKNSVPRISDMQCQQDEDLSYLVGAWQLFQKIDTHRYSTDDLVTSWASVREIKLLQQLMLSKSNSCRKQPYQSVDSNSSSSYQTAAPFATSSSLISSLSTLYHMDIGCGIGSVLLSNAWLFRQYILGDNTTSKSTPTKCNTSSPQLPYRYTSSLSIGIEVQRNRFELAQRSIMYNLGDCFEKPGLLLSATANAAITTTSTSSHQITTRVKVIQEDLRNVDEIIELCSTIKIDDDSYNNNNDTNDNRLNNNNITDNNITAVSSSPPAATSSLRYFDVVTGTPPYFNPHTIHSHNTSQESMGCLFEMKGSIVQYCITASQFLRPPPPPVQILPSPLLSSSYSSSTIIPSIFAVCHSSLHSKSVYLSCAATNMVVIRRVDVISKQGKPALFTVFVCMLQSWLKYLNELQQHHREEGKTENNISDDLNTWIDGTDDVIIDENNNSLSQQPPQQKEEDDDDDDDEEEDDDEDQSSLRIDHLLSTENSYIRNIDMAIACLNESDMMTVLDDIRFHQVQEQQHDNNSNSNSNKVNYKGTGRIEKSVYGECCEILTVRDANNQHTESYQQLLADLNKPSSRYKEKY